MPTPAALDAVAEMPGEVVPERVRRPEGRGDSRQEGRGDSRSEGRGESRPEGRGEGRSDRGEARPEGRGATRSEARPDARPEPRSDNRSESREDRPRRPEGRDDRPRRRDDDLGPSVRGFGDSTPAFMLIAIPKFRRDPSTAPEAAAPPVPEFETAGDASA